MAMITHAIDSVSDEELDKISVKFRDPLFKLLREGKNYDTIAGEIGVPVGTVKSRISRARDAVAALREVAPEKIEEAA